MPPTKLHGLKTSSSESIASPTVEPSVASHLIRSRRLQNCQSRVPSEFESILARSLSRCAHAQTLERAAAPSVSTVRRLLAFLRCVRFTEPQLSRHSRSSIHREFARCSRNSFRASVLNPMKSPRLNFEVRHWLVTNEALIRCFVCMSFAGSVVEVLGDGVALGLG